MGPILQVVLLTMQVIARPSGAPRSPVHPILQVPLLTVPGAALDHAGDLSGLQVTILIA